MAHSCFCRKPRKQHLTAEKSWLCHQCWEMQSDNVYYQCGDCPKCQNPIGDRCPQVCSKCAFLEHDSFSIPMQNDQQMIMSIINGALDKIEHMIAACSDLQDLQDYVTRIHLEFYDSWCSNCMLLPSISMHCDIFDCFVTVETTEIGSNEEFKSAMNRYQTLMDGILKRIQQLIDEKQLGLTMDVMEIVKGSNNAISCKKEVKQLITRIVIEWQDLNDDQKEIDVPEFEGAACNDGDHCRVRKRVIFIGKLFQDHLANLLIGVDSGDTVKLENMLYLDVFQHCLSGYTALSLLNDINHIKSLHDDGRNALQCDCYESQGQCPGDSMRKYRQKECGDDVEDSKTEQETTPFEQYMNGLDGTERLIMDISTKMHDALCHRHYKNEEAADTDGDDKEYKVRPINWWKTRTPNNNQTNKFINEVAVKEDETAGGRMDELDDLLLHLTPGFHAHVITEYVAKMEDELSIKPGEVLRVTKAPDANGWTKSGESWQ